MTARRLTLATVLAISAAAAHAQTWQPDGDGAALIPASVAGVAVNGARLTCLDGVWSLTLGEGAPALGSDVVAVALVIDGQPIPTTAASGAIAVPVSALDPLRAGSRLTVAMPSGGATVETVFALRASRGAIDAALASCPAATVAATDPEPAKAAVTLDIGPDIVAGLPVRVVFEGPNREGDWIGFALPGSDGSSWVGGSYAYTNAGSPLSFLAPDAAGDYELRYLNGADSAILLAVAVTVAPANDTGPVVVKLAPVTAAAGSEIAVDPGDVVRLPGDYLYISPVGSGDQDYSGGWIDIPAEGPARIIAPTAPGDWELRYMRSAGDGQYTVLGRAPLTLQ